MRYLFTIYSVALGLAYLFMFMPAHAESIDASDPSVTIPGVQLASTDRRQAASTPNRRQRAVGWCPQYDAQITREARRHPNSARLRVVAHAFMYQETRCGRGGLVGPRTRHGRAYGLLQVLCSTAHSMGLNGSCTQLKNPRVGIKFGVAYISERIQRYGGRNIKTLATAYNAGDGRVGDSWLPRQTRQYIIAVSRYQHMVPGGGRTQRVGVISSMPGKRNVIDI